MEEKIINCINNNMFISDDCISELINYLECSNNIDIEGINNILKIIFEYNDIVYKERKEENKIYMDAIDLKSSDTHQKTDYFIDKYASEDYDEDDNSLNIDVSFYLAQIENANTYEEIVQILPDKRNTNYLEIIDSILLYYYSNIIDIKKYLREINDDEMLKYKEFLEEKIEFIKRYKNELSLDSVTVKKNDNIILFLTTNASNVCVLSDIEKNISPDVYWEFKQLIESIKDGTFKGVKQMSSSSPLAGLSEVRAHPRQGRVVFKNISENIYILLHAFIKKDTSSSRLVNTTKSRYYLLKQSLNDIKEKIKDPNYIEYNNDLYNSVIDILDSKKDDVNNGKTYKID